MDRTTRDRVESSMGYFGGKNQNLVDSKFWTQTIVKA